MVTDAVQKISTVADVSDRDFRDMSTFANIEALFPDGLVDASTTLGDGFAVLDANGKDRLCGVPLVFIEWKFSKGDYMRDGIQQEFAIIRVAQLDEKMANIVGKFIVIDGSTGLCDQIKDYTAQSGRFGGLVVRHGLRKSEYDYTDEKGNTSPAVTYYADLSA